LKPPKRELHDIKEAINRRNRLGNKLTANGVDRAGIFVVKRPQGVRNVENVVKVLHIYADGSDKVPKLRESLNGMLNRQKMGELFKKSK
jgi:hypothetical protein